MTVKAQVERKRQKPGENLDEFIGRAPDRVVTVDLPDTVTNPDECFIVHSESAKVIRLVDTHEEALKMVSGTNCLAYPMTEEFVSKYCDQIAALRAKAKEQMHHEESTANGVESIARLAHVGQTRRDGMTPYIDHPRAVAERVKGDKDAESVAWLHDVLEDTKETAETLRIRGVDEKVIEAVEAMTKRKGEPYAEYLQRVQSNPLARKVKVADMLANLSDNPTDRQILKYAKGLQFLLANAQVDAPSGAAAERR